MDCKHVNVTLEWVTPEIEAYVCHDCGKESIEPFDYLNTPKYSEKQYNDQWEYHQAFVLKICKILDLDFCLMSEDRVLDEIAILKNK